MYEEGSRYKISRLSESLLFHLNSTSPRQLFRNICEQKQISDKLHKHRHGNYLFSPVGREEREAWGTNFQEETNVWFCHFSDKLERENQTLFNCCPSLQNKSTTQWRLPAFIIISLEYKLVPLALLMKSFGPVFLVNVTWKS